MGSAEMTVPGVDASPSRRRAWRGRAFLGVVLAAGVAALVYEGYHEARRAKLVADGHPAPPFTLERYGGGTVSLAELEGKIVLIDFWATWCPPCVEEMPGLFKVTEEYADRGVVLIAADRIETDSRAAVGVFLARNGLKVPANAHVAFASERMLDDYQIRALPTLYVVDRQGRIADAHQAYASEAKLRELIDRALQR